MSERLRRAWQRRGLTAALLWPLSQLYRLLTALRRALYRSGLLARERLPVPVLVIGNVIAGGAGKTPVTMAIVAHLRARGWRPGVISRGYGRKTQDCRAVLPDSTPAEVGDEPLLIALRSGVPVFVARQRADAGHALLAAHPEVNVLVCDDGLQHLALARDVEVCVFNNEGVGNGWLLPAGPLREPWPRPVDALLYSGTCPPHAPAGRSFALTRQLADTAVTSDGRRLPLAQLAGQRLHALAAIARPEEFFAMLRARGLALEHTEGLPDHHNFDSWKRPPDKRLALICTEKDATKLWPHHPDALAVPLTITIAPAFFDLLDARLPGTGEPHGPQTA